MSGTWTSPSLLTRFNNFAGRPQSGDQFIDTSKYQLLADGQRFVIDDIASRFPKVLYPSGGYSSYPTLTTTDNQIFSFGTDVNGDPLYPTGKFAVFPSLASIPDDPWTEGFDYYVQGTGSGGMTIMIPDNRTYSGTLYWYGLAPQADITASQAPSLFPVDSRILIVWQAVKMFAEMGNRNGALADRMEAKYDKDFARFALVWRTQYRSGGALAPLVSSFAADPAWVGGYGSLGGY